MASRMNLRGGTMNLYKEVVIYLLAPYDMGDVISDTDASITYHTQQAPNKTTTEYSELIYSKALRYDCVFDKPELMQIFLWGLS